MSTIVSVSICGACTDRRKVNHMNCQTKFVKSQ